MNGFDHALSLLYFSASIAQFKERKDAVKQLTGD